MTAKKPKRYRVLDGLNYPDPDNPDEELRAEPGDEVDNLPAESVKWLLKGKHIEEV